MKRIFVLCGLLVAMVTSFRAQITESFSSNIVTDEGAWCWFADPRALHYENESGTINATYIGYIDVHGNVKATQYDWLTHCKTDVLIRSYFQPDDHNNPTFVVLPDERVMVFYTRHTDEAKIWYRISRKPGDISALGEEKFLSTANNTTYPSPFILSDDPDHIYLCWRGINWHPTIARLTMPDSEDNCSFDFGPKQIVQSSGARPYAKYQSNGKDKIFLSYTTGHPDNEMPNWLYFNVIDINQGNGPILRDIRGTELKKVSDGVFNVNKTDSYLNSYPYTVVDHTGGIRNWVWQIALDKDENPVIAFPHLDDGKTNHYYYYGRWTGTEWRTTFVTNAGHAFHQNWNSTERCYSGGMSLDPDNINDLYVSMPTKDGAYNRDGVYEIWKFTINDEGTVTGSEQITQNSEKNNSRPFVIPGSKNSPLRVAWMNGDYYYWMVQKNYPKGYPTDLRANYVWEEELTKEDDGYSTNCYCLHLDKTLNLAVAMNTARYEGKLFVIGKEEITYSLDSDLYPVVTIGDKSYRSQNRLLTSDDWAIGSSGTSGDNHPTKLDVLYLSLTYDGHTLTIYRDGLVDQVIEVENVQGGVAIAYGDDFNHQMIGQSDYYACASPMTVQELTKMLRQKVEAELAHTALGSIILPTDIYTDLVLPTEVLKQPVAWTSSNEQVISNGGTVTFPAENTSVTLTATIGELPRDFTVKVYPRDIKKNLRYQHEETLDMTANTAAGFATNTTFTAPEGLLKDLRSYTFLLTANAKTLSGAPRFYDFGSGSGNSVFLRAKDLSAGIKYNGGTTTMVNAPTQLTANKEYKLAVTFDAASKTTTIYVDGEKIVSGTANQVEPYQLEQLAADSRNYIGRTQWWDSSYASDNVDFAGSIGGFRLYDIALTRKEICELQGIAYEELPTELTNLDFEDTYTVLSNSGVSSDRAIYVPKGWSVDYINRNANDLTALKTGDLYFSNFFASRPKPSEGSLQTYWVRQNWGTSTITLQQEAQLPEGRYTMTADVWKSGLGGDVIVSAVTEGGATVTAPSLQNKEAWQQVVLEFESDGKASTTIMLSAMHNNNGSEKIIGFDNIVLVKEVTDGIDNLSPALSQGESAVFDLQGRRIEGFKRGRNEGLKAGLYIMNGKKVVVR